MHNHPRLFMHAVLHDRPFVATPGLRPVCAADVPALASLMLQAYIGTIDYEGEDEVQALAEVRKTFAGGYGAFVASCSKVIEREGVLASASLITRVQNRPFVAFLMTRPEFKRRGLARACLLESMRALAGAGETEVRLMVTVGNAPAIALYESLGFLAEG